MKPQIKLKIRSKIIVLVLSITLLSLVAFLITSQIILQREMRISTGALETLKNEATGKSETGLINQASLYLNRLIVSESNISNYFFKVIEYQLAVVKDLLAELYNTNSPGGTSVYKELTSTRENPDLDLYYSLAPGIKKNQVQREIHLLGSLHTELRAAIKYNKSKEILPQSVDGIYLGTESGIFYNMTLNAYYDKNYDARQREWYIEARKNKRIGWTHVYEDVASHTYTITCYQPVYNNKGEFKAVIGMDVSLEAMIDLIVLHFKEVGEVLVLGTVINDNTLSTSGVILNSQDLSHDLNNFIGASGNINETSNQELKSFYEACVSIQQKDSTFVPKTISYNKVTKLVLYSPIEVPNLQIIVISSLDEIEKSVSNTTKSIEAASDLLIKYSAGSFQKTILVILFVFAVIATITVFILIRFARLLTKPITLLADKVEIIGNGNLDEKLEINTGDELETLAGAFNKMTGDLKNYIATLKETTAAKERIESELQIAHKIQASMLPRIFPAFPTRQEFEIYASMYPAKDVGGDYFDFFLINDRKLCFTIGDVSGKGIPGSLFMVISKTLMKMEAATGVPLNDVVGKVNNALCEDNDEMMFVTTILFTIDLETGQIEYVNAGHNPPLLKRSGSDAYEYMKPFHGFVLGARPDYTFKLETMQLAPGDTLVLYTDGVTEAMNSEQKQYSTDRLQARISSLEDGDAISIEEAITTDLRDFVQDTPASDDITILVFRYNQRMKPS